MKKFTSQGWEDQAISPPTEFTVSLNVNGKAWVTLQCLPQELEALSIGFLFNEGVIQAMPEITLLEICPDRTLVDIWLNHAAQRPENWRLTSGCAGGKTSVEYPLENHPQGAPSVPPPTEEWHPEAILQLTADFIDRTQQERIPGTHASGLYHLRGNDGGSPKLERICMDIGRHNTLDKLAGFSLLDGYAPTGMALISTGRVSADMLQKAARMGVPCIISLRSATSMAIQLAQTWQITLIAHSRRTSFDLLHNAGRLTA